MNKIKEIPGFLPEDYDKEPPGIEDAELDATQLYWLKHDQKASEDGIALGEYMSADFDSYIVIGFKKEKRENGVVSDHELVCGNCHVDNGDYDAVSEMARQLGWFAFKNPEVAKILRRAMQWKNSLMDEELNPEPPQHMYLPRDERFHLNRYNRILSEKFEKVEDEFCNALGDYTKRRTIKMKMVLTAIADQLNDNEPVQVDFFCNFILEEKSDGDNVSGIGIKLKRVPCTWEEAEANRDHFIELCKQYDVPCHIEWLQD